MTEKFCPKCGETKGDFYDGFCIKCYSELNTLVEIPDEIEITTCKRCGRWFLNNNWTEDSFQNLKRVILNKLKTNLHYPKIDIDTENEYALITIEGFVDKIKQYKVSKSKKVKITFKNTCCERDLKISSKTWEYQIQLRREQEFDPFLFEKIEKSIKKEIQQLSKSLPEATAFWTEETKDGVDFFFGFKQVGDIIIKKLKHRFKLKIMRSASLVGMDKNTGKKKFKQTFCIRV